MLYGRPVLAATSEHGKVGKSFCSNHAKLTAPSIEERLEKNGLLPFRPLVFAVLYAAVYSLSASDVTSRFEDDRRRMMATYHRGLHLSLMAVDVFSSPSIEVLQAFVLFLVSAVL